ncbi:MAG: cupin domain-containing protein [Isosphaeraceae bacterium]
MPTAQQIIEALRLQPHPIEWGYFRETYRAFGSIPASLLPPGYPREGTRSLGTSIYYLLTPETFSETWLLGSDLVISYYGGRVDVEAS